MWRAPDAPPDPFVDEEDEERNSGDEATKSKTEDTGEDTAAQSEETKRKEEVIKCSFTGDWFGHELYLRHNRSSFCSNVVR